MRILGVDPGIGRTGWAVIEAGSKAGRGGVSAVSYGCIETSSSKKFPERMVEIVSALERVIVQYSPEAAAIEEMFFLKKSKTLLLAVQARGVAIYAVAKNNLPVFEYNPKNVKITLTGYGLADKLQIQKMIMLSLRLKEVPKPDDTADALAIALCHFYNSARAQ